VILDFPRSNAFEILIARSKPPASHLGVVSYFLPVEGNRDACGAIITQDGSGYQRTIPPQLAANLMEISCESKRNRTANNCYQQLCTN
jgi:hypothetical protein